MKMILLVVVAVVVLGDVVLIHLHPLVLLQRGLLLQREYVEEELCSVCRLCGILASPGLSIGNRAKTGNE